LAVALHVGGTRGDDAIALARDERPREPAPFGAEHAGLLEPREPVPLEERRIVADERIPLLARKRPNAIDELEHRHAAQSSSDSKTEMHLGSTTAAHTPRFRRSEPKASGQPHEARARRGNRFHRLSCANARGAWEAERSRPSGRGTRPRSR